MSTYAKDVIGLKIITIATGAQIETVEDVVYDPSTQRITALLVNKGGFFSKPHAIAIEEVKSIGKDAVLVENEQAIKKVDELGGSVEDITSHAFNLVKTDIITQEGTQLGKVSDLVFDATSGTVEEMIITQGGIKNMTGGKKRVKPADIVTIGADATIVSNYIEDEFSEQSEAGGIKGALNSAQDKLGEVKDTVTDKAQQTVEKVKEIPENPTVQDKLTSAREGASELGGKAMAAGAVVGDKVKDATGSSSDGGSSDDKKTDDQTDQSGETTQVTVPTPTSTPPPVGQEVRSFDRPEVAEGIEPQSQDFDTPFSPPSDADIDSSLNVTHPVTDSANNIDAHETYDEGLAGATEASEPNAGNTVVGYDPKKDNRQD